MYCNHCGKHNPEDSKYCRYCGVKIVRVSTDQTTSRIDTESKSSTTNSNKKTEPGHTGWVAILGLGLIISLIAYGYTLSEYIPLFSEDYSIPGYLTFLHIEFLVNIIFTISISYILYLYFKKNKKFPKYYLVFLTASIVFGILDHLFVSSLNIPTQELQKVMDDILSENLNELGRTITISTIWILYIALSKQVKGTFTKN